MRPAIVVLGSIALVVAGGAGLMLSRFMDTERPAASHSGPAAPAAKTFGILTAGDNFDVGKVIDAGSLVWQDWPEAPARDAAGHGAIMASDDKSKIELAKPFEGAVTRVVIAKGQPLTDDMVVHVDKSSVLSAVLAPGMRSVTLTVDPILSAAGQLQPNDRIDLVLTMDLTDNGAGAVDPQTGTTKPRVATETILTNLRVLTADRRMAVNTAADAPIPTNVTLEVTPEQAERIFTAQRMGKLNFVIRPLRGGDEPNRVTLKPTTDVAVAPALRAARLGVPEEKIDPKTNPWVESRNKPDAPPAGGPPSQPVPAAAPAVPEKPREVTVYHFTVPTTIPIGNDGMAVPTALPQDRVLTPPPAAATSPVTGAAMPAPDDARPTIPHKLTYPNLPGRNGNTGTAGTTGSANRQYRSTN